jgi:hypothetical protein
MSIARQDPPRPAQPTVGDTLTVVHRVSVPSGTLVQPRGPTDSTIATLIGPPLVSREGDSVRIAYTMAVWAPGRHNLVIPGAITVAGDGTVDTLADATVSYAVASVLPPEMAAESVTPQAAQPWVERVEPSGWPFLVLLVPVVLVFAAVALWWRRRGRGIPAPGPRVIEAADIRSRLERWRVSGESGLVIDHLLGALPDDPVTAAWRARVEAIRFDPASTAQLDQLVAEGLALYDAQQAAR